MTANPGSVRAIELGCVCDPVENNDGLGAWDGPGINGIVVPWFRFKRDCVLHGRGDWRERRVDRVISPDAAARVKVLLDEITGIVNAEQAQMDQGELAVLPAQLRYAAMRIGSCEADFTFWVYKDRGEPGDWWVACEVNSDDCLAAVSPRQALDEWFARASL